MRFVWSRHPEPRHRVVHGAAVYRSADADVRCCGRPIGTINQRHLVVASLDIVNKCLIRAANDPLDDEARGKMILAASYAGVGFGNASVHLPHGMLSRVGQREELGGGRAEDHPLVPHRFSIVLAPAVFHGVVDRSGICTRRRSARNGAGVKKEDAARCSPIASRGSCSS